MRALRLLLYFAAGLLLGGVSAFATAETISATAKSAGTITATPLWVTGGTYKNASLSGACNAWRSAAGRTIGLCGPDSEGNGLYGTCFYDTGDAPNKICWQADAVKAGCEPGYSFNGTTKMCVNTETIYTCPAGQNWTLSGQSCTRPDCPNGRLADGTCAPSCPAAGTKQDVFIGGDGTNLASSYCDASNCRQTITVLSSGGYQCSFSASGVGTCREGFDAQMTYTGESCSAGTPAAPAPVAPGDLGQPCPPNYGKASAANGFIRCLPPGTTTSDGSSSSTTSTTPPGASAPSTTTSNTTNNTICTGDGSCTTTTTTTSTTNVPGGSPQTTTTTTANTESKADFCAKNPQNEVCSSGGDGEGNGEGGALGGVPSLYERTYPDGLVGVWNDRIADIKATPIFGLSAVFTPTGVSGGSCPSWTFNANIGSHMNFGSGSISPPCWIWPAIKAIVIISALLLARRLIFGG